MTVNQCIDSVGHYHDSGTMKTVIGENLDAVMRTLQIDRFAKNSDELKRYIQTAACSDADYNNTACPYCDSRYTDGKCFDICPHNTD